MGCLPLPILFVLGVLIGEWLGGDRGALWGAGIGLLLGLGLGGAFIVALRRRRLTTVPDAPRAASVRHAQGRLRYRCQAGTARA